MTLPINKPTPSIACWHDRWAKNRAFVEGEDAVKAEGRTYLPPARWDDSDLAYCDHKDRTNFYPATTKITQGILGLIFRKAAEFKTGSSRVELLSELITLDGQSRDDLAEWCARESLITNFTGLLPDHPDASTFTGLSAANADTLGYRPRIACYIGENILEVTKGTNAAGTKNQLVHVRLLELEGKQVRQLLINDSGLYEVRIHAKGVDGTFAEVSRSIPRRDGEPLTEIPFVLVSTSDKLCPTPSMLQHCVDLNLQHYRASGVRAAIEHLTSSPIAVTFGFVPEKGPDGKPKNPGFDTSPGAIWFLPSPDQRVEWFTFDPKGAQLNSETLANIKQDLSTLGHSILAPEKPAPESPETQLLRTAAENASLGFFTRQISRKLEEAFKEFARWADPSDADLSFSLNLDFHPEALSPAEHKELRDDWLAGAITLETYQQSLQQGEVLPATFDPKAEAEKLLIDAADRPPVF